jgi:glycosyltransferase involved in cell wall biosynthesis
MRRVPSVVSLDATPLQYDALGAFYGHVPSGNGRVEALKKRLNARAFGAARRLVAWSEWTKASLVADYGVPPEKVAVIPPGIDTELWDFPARVRQPGEAVNVLFVGGDFARKGGDTLLAAFRDLPASAPAHLHLVTQTPGVADGVPNVSVHHGLTANSAPLRQLFAQADLFAFPTRGDCLPLAVMEAMAAGLPVVTTHVGALAEAVTHGQTGLVVPPDDPQALRDAIRLLATDSPLRTQMGCRAREAARARFDAHTNYRRLIDTVKSVSR